MDFQVVEITRDEEAELDRAVEILALSFATDPITRYFFPGTDSLHDDLTALFGVICRSRLAMGEPLLGLRSADGLAGVANVEGPGRTPRWQNALTSPALGGAVLRLVARCGPGIVPKLERYTQKTGEHRPDARHHYLVCIGVHPSMQGRGCGRAILEAVEGLARRDGASVGVGLDTENPDNVGLYERFGYAVTGRVDLDGVPAWCMFRPFEERSPAPG